MCINGRIVKTINFLNQLLQVVMVCIITGMASWNFAIGGTIKCSGLFFTELLELFGASLSSTSWVGASVSLMNFLACEYFAIYV